MPWGSDSGPAVARLFSRALAIIFLIAWISLGVQLPVLLGSHGLLPAGEFIEAAREQPGIGVVDLPTIFWWFHSDRALTAGVAIGATLSIAAFLGLEQRLCFALSTLLYLSYVTVAREFMSFQWDNLLLECGVLAVFLPAKRSAPLVDLLFRVLLFKLYFESGVAKWQSPLHDWRDGSAMTYYYETAPLPTWLAWRAHHLPAWWHHFESRATLVLELVVPLAIFGPRGARLAAAAAFTLFQIGNAATANYGFFCYLAVALHLFLLDDRDVERGEAAIRTLFPAAWRARLGAVKARSSSRLGPLLRPRRRARPDPAQRATAAPSGDGRRLPRWVAWTGAGLYLFMGLADALYHFTEPGPLLAVASPLLEANQRLRFVNSYHLFASVTRDRIEPEIQTLGAASVADATPPDAAPDEAWIGHDLRHKPGDVMRPPDFVAPHQPRVDFQLWFYGLSFERREPAYVAALLERVCEDAPAVQPLFRALLPSSPRAVRLVFWRYQFTSPTEARATKAWWRRARIAVGRALPCPKA